MLSMSAPGKAWENGYAERWMRTLKEEEAYLNEYDVYAEAHANLGHFIDVVYNKKRMHSAIGDLSSAQFEAQWRTAQ
jgi:putative transposase